MAAACSWACGGRTAPFGGHADRDGVHVQDPAAAGNNHTEADANTSGNQTRHVNSGGDPDSRKANDPRRKAGGNDRQHRKTGVAAQ